MNLFDGQDKSGDDIREIAGENVPLAERVRPRSLAEVVGQQHLLAAGAPLRAMVESGRIPSLILWGPPGTGKTTIVQTLAGELDSVFVRLSAIESGVKELRTAIARAEIALREGRRTIVFIDEIHRFNKSQQDALLHAVERGILTLVGATTENPSFEVNPALLSRCRVFALRQLEEADLRDIVARALAADPWLVRMAPVVEGYDALFRFASGDARRVLGLLEHAVMTAGRGAVITDEVVAATAQSVVARYDKGGEQHYDTASALIKSLRGSDPDAALFWLAVMLEGGEDVVFIARRLVIFASEDIGNADPRALELAVATARAAEFLGMPEARIPLGHCVTYLATTPKSNRSYRAIDAALALVRSGVPTAVPLHLRNAPTWLMKQEGYGGGYRYPHDEGGFSPGVNYFPDGVKPQAFYKPSGNGAEERFADRLGRLWPGRYNQEQ